MRWILSTVDGEDDNRVRCDAVVDRVREPTQDRSPCLPSDELEGLRIFGDQRDNFGERVHETVGGFRTVAGVPRLSRDGIGIGERTKDHWKHGLRAQLLENVRPWHARFRMREMIGPPTIEFCNQFGADGKRVVALGVRQALPEGDRELGPCTRRELEQVRKGGSRHDRIVALHQQKRNRAGTSICIRPWTGSNARSAG